MVLSATIRVPGGAPLCMREAVFTTSPWARPSLVSGWDRASTMASPVFTAARTVRSSSGCSRFSSSMASRTRSPARTARSASSPWATGAPNTAMTASPMTCSTSPPNDSIFGLDPGVVGHEHGPHVLRVGLVGPGGELDEVYEQDRDDLALLRSGGPDQRRAAVLAEPGLFGVLCP